jgi:SagB-type dehydrogenase family enzyme
VTSYLSRKVKSYFLIFITLIILTAIGCTSTKTPGQTESIAMQEATIALPAPRLKGKISLEEALQNRRSIREYKSTPLKLYEVSQLLWAAQGITSDWGGRTAPSAGALYPLEVYLVAGNVEGLDSGIYRYAPSGHQLVRVKVGDFRAKLSEAALNQSCVADAPISLVIIAIYERTTVKYGDRGIMYVHLEAGHAAQNICLQAVALGLGAVPVGAFEDQKVIDVIGMSKNESPLYIIPVGEIHIP